MVQSDVKNCSPFCTKVHLLDSDLKTAPSLSYLVYAHRGQNLKQINVAKYVSKFLIYVAKMLEKCVKSKKKNFVHCPFLQSQAK